MKRAAVAVVLDRRVVDREKAKGFAVENPHGNGVAVEQEAKGLAPPPDRRTSTRR